MSSVTTFVNTATICFILYILYKNNMLLDTFATQEKTNDKECLENKEPPLENENETGESIPIKDPKPKAKRQLLFPDRIAAPETLTG